MAAFPGPAWASLHSSPAERLGLAEPGVLCLSQSRLPPAPEPAQCSGFVRDSPGGCLELGVGTACLACPCWVGCWSPSSHSSQDNGRGLGVRLQSLPTPFASEVGGLEFEGQPSMVGGFSLG